MVVRHLSPRSSGRQLPAPSRAHCPPRGGPGADQPPSRLTAHRPQHQARAFRSAGFSLTGILRVGSETVDRPCQATPASWRGEGGCSQRIFQRQSTGVAISEEIVESESVGVAGGEGDSGHGRVFTEDGGGEDSGAPRRGPSGRGNRAVVDHPGTELTGRNVWYVRR